MSALTEMDAGKVIVIAASIVGLIAVIATVRAVVLGNLRRAVSAAIVGALAIAVAAVGAVWVGLDALGALA